MCGLRYLLGVALLATLWAQDGKALFQANCASCHAINKRVVGPALRGVHERWGNDEGEIIKFVHNSQAYINGNFKNSAYAKKLYEEYNRSVMTAFTGLSDAEIKSILDYIKTETEALAKAETPAPSAQGGVSGPADGQAPGTTSPLLWVLALSLGPFLSPSSSRSPPFPKCLAPSVRKPQASPSGKGSSLSSVLSVLLP
jgi:cytochrome c551/c552